MTRKRKNFPRLLLALVLAAAPVARAQSSSLTGAQIRAFETLTGRAQDASPEVARARADVQAAKLDGTFWGATTATAGASVNLGGFDQVQPASTSLRLGLSVDLVKLARGNADGVRVALFQEQAARAKVRADVLAAFTGYLFAFQQAGNAALSLSARSGEVRVAEVRRGAGAATGGDVAAAQEKREAARLAVYRANLDLANAKQGLASLCGLSLSDLDRALSGAKP